MNKILDGIFTQLTELIIEITFQFGIILLLFLLKRHC